jgi:hypothetical protein
MKNTATDDDKDFESSLVIPPNSAFKNIKNRE